MFTAARSSSSSLSGPSRSPPNAARSDPYACSVRSISSPSPETSSSITGGVDECGVRRERGGGVPRLIRSAPKALSRDKGNGRLVSALFSSTESAAVGVTGKEVSPEGTPAPDLLIFPPDAENCLDINVFRLRTSSCITNFFKLSRFDLLSGSKSKSSTKTSTCNKNGTRSAELSTTASLGLIRTTRWCLPLFTPFGSGVRLLVASLCS